MISYDKTLKTVLRYFAYSCPDLPRPFVEEAIFAPFYASSPFVKYSLTVET